MPSYSTFAPHDPRRQSERHVTDAVSCDVGRILDLSSGGMRLVLKGKGPLTRKGGASKLKLQFTGGSLNLQVQTVWAKRAGFRHFEVGLRFIGLTPGHAIALDQIARYGFIKEKKVRIGGDATATPKGRPTVAEQPATPTLYDALGVAADATDEEIKSAYRALALKFHPDRTDDTRAHAVFLEVTRAYETLIDPDRRREYDLRKAG